MKINKKFYGALMMFLGIVVFGIAVLLTYGLEHVEVHTNWYIAFFSFAYVVSIFNLIYGFKYLLERKCSS